MTQAITWVDIAAGALILISATLIAVGASRALSKDSSLHGNPYMALAGILFLAVPIAFTLLMESIGETAVGEDAWARYAACIIFAMTIIPTLRSVIEDVVRRRAQQTSKRPKKQPDVDDKAAAHRRVLFEKTQQIHHDWMDRIALNWNHGMVPASLTAKGTGTVLSLLAAARRHEKSYVRSHDEPALHHYREAVLALRAGITADQQAAREAAGKCMLLGPESLLDRRGKLNLILDGILEREGTDKP